MEHIRTHHVDKVIANCLEAAQHVFFQISTVDDKASELVGHKLHLTVRPFKWWLNKFKEHDCIIHWSKKTKGGCSFYVTAWTKGKEFIKAGRVNVGDEQTKKNVAYNIKQGFLEIQPHPTNNIETMIIGGGPSLSQHVKKIKQLRANGVKLIAINGAYKWCLDNGITPSAMVMVDARKFNARFTQPVVKDCKYFIASQCHPSVFKGLPKDRTYVWHTQAEELTEMLQAQFEECYPVPGGSTVLLRAIPLFRMLGFKRFHIFGCDSCLEENKHHAYEQLENDDELIIPVNVSGKIFNCHPWMVSQAQEFIDLIKMIGDEIELEVYGGLLHHILESGASYADIKEI